MIRYFVFLQMDGGIIYLYNFHEKCFVSQTCASRNFRRHGAWKKFGPIIQQFAGSLFNTAWKVSVFGVFLARIFPHLDLIRRDKEYLSVFSPNSRKCSLEKLRILTLFTQCNSALKSQSMLNLSKYAYHTNDNCLWTNFWRNLYCYYHYCYCNRLALQLFSEIILIFWSLCKSEASLEPSQTFKMDLIL